jgi:uncharacterized protein (TIGR02594 family)
MKLPSKYKWLLNIGILPRTIELSIELLGVQEVVGKGSNKTIISWRDDLNQEGVSIKGFSDDDIAWCGLFVAFITFMRRGESKDVVKDPLWARNWVNYGIKSKKPSLGDVLVFKRNGGGHVGFYIAEDSFYYHVIGGNQGNRVSITRIEKSRLLEARSPIYNNKPNSVKPYLVSASGSISKNEA